MRKKEMTYIVDQNFLSEILFYFVLLILFAACQTDPWPEFEHTSRPATAATHSNESSMSSNPASHYFRAASIENDDEHTRLYTGFASWLMFMAVVDYLTPKALGLTQWNGKSTGRQDKQARGPRAWRTLSVADQLLAVLVRLRRGLCAADVCFRMGLKEATYSRLFTTWVPFLAAELRLLFPFPSRSLINDWMPNCFRKRYPSTRVVIDCYEVQVERPSGLMNQSATYSDYKGRNTVKYLLGCTPSGLVSFLSNGWGGRTSDKEITKQSGLLKHLEEGDNIMADRGFDLQEVVAPLGVTVNIPPFLAGKKQMAASDVEKTRRIAELRIHVERAIGRGRAFQILEGKFPLKLIDLSDDINTICMYVPNFDKPLVQ